jgi:hypothetical protein
VVLTDDERKPLPLPLTKRIQLHPRSKVHPTHQRPGARLEGFSNTISAQPELN